MRSFSFSSFPELSVNQFLLRRLSAADAESVFTLRSNTDILRYLHREPAQSVEEVLAFIQSINRAFDENESVLWGIAPADEPHKCIGTVCFWNIRKENFRAELGYLLHPNYWRKGIMKTILPAVIDYGFSNMHLHSIDAVVDSANESSARLLEYLGFTREAYFKEDLYYQGQFYNTCVYLLLNNTR